MKKMIEGFFHYFFLLQELVKRGITLKYRRSYLGILWSLLEPLLTMIVLTIIFGTLLGKGGKDYPVYILSGRLLYSFFSQGTTNALKSIRANSGMIKKVYIPKYLYPLSGVLFNYIIFLISLIVLVAVGLVLGVKPNMYIFQVFVPLIILFLLTFGIGMILATIGVFFRDMEYLWGVATMLIMYASAIFYYPETILEAKTGWILRFNPLFAVISNFRSAIFGEPMDLYYTFYSLGFAVVSLIIGIVLFYKKQDKFILHI